MGVNISTLLSRRNCSSQDKMEPTVGNIPKETEVAPASNGTGPNVSDTSERQSEEIPISELQALKSQLDAILMDYTQLFNNVSKSIKGVDIVEAARTIVPQNLDVPNEWNFTSIGVVPLVIAGESAGQPVKFQHFLEEDLIPFYRDYLPLYNENLHTLLVNNYSEVSESKDDIKNLKDDLNKVSNLMTFFFDKTDKKSVQASKVSNNYDQFIFLTILEVANGITYLYKKVDHYVVS